VRCPRTRILCSLPGDTRLVFARDICAIFGKKCARSAPHVGGGQPRDAVSIKRMRIYIAFYGAKNRRRRRARPRPQPELATCFFPSFCSPSVWQPQNLMYETSACARDMRDRSIATASAQMNWRARFVDGLLENALHISTLVLVFVFGRGMGAHLCISI
jgi:hypothetical protein